jgi:hypothetical protein
MSAHTPGPWFFSEPVGGKVRIYAANNAYVANVKFDAARGIVNARLIASAPDLLEALKLAECAVQELCADQDPANQCWVTLADVRAAIAKATAAPEAGQ